MSVNPFLAFSCQGYCTETKVTPIITKTGEDKLWEADVMSLDNPIGLLRATFFYNGKNFVYRKAWSIVIQSSHKSKRKLLLLMER